MNMTSDMRPVSADELLACDWPMKYACEPNGTNKGYLLGCACCLIHGDGFDVEVHCWRSGCAHGCQYSGIHVKGRLDEATLLRIGHHIRDNNAWTNSTHWDVTANGQAMGLAQEVKP